MNIGYKDKYDEVKEKKDTLAFSYNELKQLSKRSSPNLQLDYTYRTISGNKVSSQVSALKLTLKNGSGSTTKQKNLNYTYDNLGNIETVNDGTATTTYSYDSQNQLTLSVTGNDSSGYTYGNIRTKTHSYASGLASENYTFTYGNSQWKDQLTQVSYTSTSGVTTTDTLSYDAIGNPTKYFNGKMV